MHTEKKPQREHKNTIMASYHISKSDDETGSNNSICVGRLQHFNKHNRLFKYQKMRIYHKFKLFTCFTNYSINGELSVMKNIDFL